MTVGIRARLIRLILLLNKMNGGSASMGIAMEKLVGNNYSYWTLCMEAYLHGQDLWDLIEGDDTKIPADTPQNAKLRQQWKIKCGKALFILRTLISKEYIDHVCDLKSPKQVWDTLQNSPQWYDIVHFEHKLSWLCFGLPKRPHSNGDSIPHL